ncbi:GGDEF domain-containing protein [Cognaticolwellia mytili]|uniref:GGDEF domain-containing protein n=1 Tax=Cognaticolwellia mytili TaxID=1888913 RepID=UPI000A1711A1|nr:GGDEF domain-containing protein [Cognaticolwellia mytili]
MFQYFSSLKNSIVSLLGFFISLLLINEFQSFWLVKINLIEQVIYGLLAVTVVLSSYFNRSRLALSAALFLLFYLNLSNVLPWSKWLSAQNDWLTLSLASMLPILSLVKDRGLVSIHGLYRIVLLVMVGLGCYYWLSIQTDVSAKLTNFPLLVGYLKYVSLDLPLLLCGLLLIWQTLREKSLVTTALFSSYVIWLGDYYQLILLPWSVLLTLITLHYLVVVLVDSYLFAYRDELTTLPSRRALNQLALALGRKYTLAMLDIDHFKKFNDTYGHDIGDQVLKLVASKLAQVKGGGKVFRYGGEEFTIVFSGKTPEQALPLLEAVRQAVQDYKVVIRQPQRKTKKARSGKSGSDIKTVSVTISIGVAARVDKLNFEQTLKSADQALYRAKKSGRNKVSQ